MVWNVLVGPFTADNGYSENGIGRRKTGGNGEAGDR